MENFKKVFILFLIMFVLCGCSATYNLDMTEVDYKEELIINGNYEELSNYGITRDAISYRFYDMSINANNPLEEGSPVEDDEEEEAIVDNNSDKEIYKKMVDLRDNEYFVTYSYDKFNYNTIADSSIIRSAYNAAANLRYPKNNYVQISTNSAYIFNIYDYLDSITVNIKTNKDLIETNCDEHKDNVYTWYITRENNKKIYLKTKLNNEREYNLEDNKKEDTSVTIEKKDDNVENESSNSKYSKMNSFLKLLIMLGLFGVILVLLLMIKR